MNINQEIQEFVHFVRRNHSLNTLVLHFYESYNTLEIPFHVQNSDQFIEQLSFAWCGCKK